MMDQTQSLLSQKSSDSGLHIQLHPLVLLSISDHITRHAARQQQGPIIGVLLGQQNGREITLEHIFECPITESNGEALLPVAWFEERVKQFKDVHKDPPLDIVGWWSTAPPSGPNASHLPLHQQILQNYNESAVFLAFHPSQIYSTESHASKLPLTIYESVLEGENAGDTSKEMQIDSEEPKLSIRFRELPYSVETGETEMIGVDTIAKSSLTAARTEPTPKNQNEKSAGDSKLKDQTKQQAELSHEEEELIGNLNTRLNAIRTLESRISLLKSYVLSISGPDAGNSNSTTTLSHPIIRSINSLLSHLSILTPSEQLDFSTEVLSQNNDVLLASVLGQMGENVKAVRELGRNSAVVQSARHASTSRTNPSTMGSRFEEELFADHLRQGDVSSMYS